MGGRWAVEPAHTIFAKSFKIFEMVALHLKMRQLCLSEFEFHIAFFGNFGRSFHRIGKGGKKLIHFVGRFKIEFLRRKFKASLVIHRSSRLYANKHLLGEGVVGSDIVNVVCGNKGNSRFPRKVDKPRKHGFLLLYAVILNFNIIIALAEKVFKP